MKKPKQISENSMKIRGKSSLRRAGPSWGLLGCLIGVLERLGSILGASWASWSVLGASRWHPGARRGPHMDPRKTPKSPPNQSKIALIFWSIFRCDFDPKMVPGWLPKPSKNGPKKCSIFRSFFHRFLDRSWGPKSLKMSPRVHEKLIFIKSPSPILTYLWKQK